MATNDVNPKWFEKDLSSKDQNNLKRAEYLWNEYQYRHDLIWNPVFRLTIAVVLLGIIPYTQSQLIPGLEGFWLMILLLAPPILGVVLAYIGFFRIGHELEHLEYIRRYYRPLQDHLIGCFRPKGKAEKGKDFPRDIKIYILALVAGAVFNILLVILLFSRNQL
jgi:hypothetical protein